MRTLITESISQAAEFLINGQIIAFPTETVYGLGACIHNENAIQNIFIAKGRPSDNPLIVHIADLADLNYLVEQPLHSNITSLIEAFWPGPLTLILPLNKNLKLSPIINAGLNSIAVRMPAHQAALNLIKAVKSPLVAPSANLSGKPSPTNYLHVLQDFNNIIACILKGEITEYGLESTIINCLNPDNFQLLRAGALDIEKIQKIIQLEIKNNSFNQESQPLSPGMKYKHYSPKAEITIINSNTQIINPQESAYIGLTERLENFKKVYLANNSLDYAQNLFAFFRACDEENIKTIYAQRPESEGIGFAILERLIKASGG